MVRFFGRTIFLYTMLFSAILVRLFSNPFANVLQKKIINGGLSAGNVNSLTYLILACASLWLFFAREISFTGEFWVCCAFGGLLGAVSNFYLVRALELADLSVLGPVNSYKSVVGILFGILILGEYPTLTGVGGIALIIFGSYFLSEKNNKKFSFNLLLQRGVRYRFYALVLSAIESVFIKKVVVLSSVEVAFASWACFGGLFSLIFFRFQDRGCKILSSLPKIFVIACLVGVMQYSTNFIFARMNVGYALAIFQLSGVLSVLFGFLFFREKNIFRKLVASLIMCAGASIIFVGA